MSERDEPLFELVVYLVASARLCLDEAPRCGAVRLLAGAVRLLEASGGAAGGDDAALQAWKRSIEEHLALVMSDYPAFAAWLADLAREAAAETTRRNLTTAT